MDQFDDFDDFDISSLLNQVAGSSPDTQSAQRIVLGKVRRVRQRRVATVGAAALVMFVSGAFALVRQTTPDEQRSNDAVPLSPGVSEPVESSTTVSPQDVQPNDEPITVDPNGEEDPKGSPTSIAGPAPTSLPGAITPGSTTPSNSLVPPSPTTTQSGQSATTAPAIISRPTTTLGRIATTPAPVLSVAPPTTKAPIVTAPPITKAPVVTAPPTTPAPVVTAPPTTSAPVATTPPVVTTPPETSPELKIWSCGGGSVVYEVSTTGLVLIKSTPTTGFVVDTKGSSKENNGKANELVVKFKPLIGNDKRKSTLKIKRSDVTSTTCEDENFNRSENEADSESTDDNEEDADD